MSSRPARVLVGLLLLATGSFALANLRAAIFRDHGAGGALRPVPGLTLRGETLAFAFDGVHRGPMPDLDRQPQACQVEAVYRLEAAEAREATFSFITPSAEGATARVNGQPVKVVSVPFEEPPRLDRMGQTVAERRFSLGFEAPLRVGPNEVAVTYRQLLGADEGGLAYFHRSRWRSFAGYEFWPVKEWTRAADFRADITLSVPRRRGLWETLTGPDLRLGAEGRDRGAARPLALEGTLSRTADRLWARYSLRGEALPDHLTVSATEK